MYIKQVLIDWNRIGEDSFLRGIEALRDVEKIDFNKPVTFFVGEKGRRTVFYCYSFAYSAWSSGF